MKKKSLAIKIWITVLAVLLMGSLSSAFVYAQDYDSTRKGSITIQLDDLDTEFSGVVFACYKVADADVDVNLRWGMAPELAGLPLDLNELETAEDYQDAANLLASEISGTSIAGQQVKTDASGKAVFPSLEQGVYLLVQADTASYGTVEPFLIGIPYMEDGSEWVYDVQTETKGEPLSEKPKQDTEKDEEKDAEKNAEKDATEKDTTKPKTGDGNNLSGWMVLMVCAGVVLILSVTFWYKHKKETIQ